MLAEQRVAKIIKNGYGWKKLKPNTHIKLMRKIGYALLAPSDKNDDESKLAMEMFASFMAGRIDHFYSQEDDDGNRINLLIPFENVLATITKSVSDEIKKNKKAPKKATIH